MRPGNTLGLVGIGLAIALLLALPTVVQAGPPLQAPIPHGEDVTDCLACHETGMAGAPKIPDDHAGRTNESCALCHKPGEAEGAAEPETTTATDTPTVAATPAESARLPTPSPTPPETPAVELTPTEPVDSPTPPLTDTPMPEPTATLVPSRLTRALETRPAPPPEAFKGPDFCAQCHGEIYHEWEATRHSGAMADPVFQQAWLEARQPGYCLACHTTGYDVKSGDFAFEGVTCESCHGAYKEGHPPDPMAVNESAEFCGRCHTGVHSPTYEEWLVSGHAKGGIECTSCHRSHSESLRADTPSELCGRCHREAYEGSVHSIEGLSCEGCHMYRGPEDADFKGTGHTFEIAPEVCAGCHAMIHSMRKTGPASKKPPLDQQVADLNTQVTGIEERSTSNLNMGLTVGAIGALPLGFAIAWLWLRRSSS